MKCCDLLIFPRLESPKEGLGLVVVEAQTAGLPVLTTPGISDDAIFTNMVERVSLSAPLATWLTSAQQLLSLPRMSDEQCETSLANSNFAMKKSVERILELYA